MTDERVPDVLAVSAVIHDFQEFEARQIAARRMHAAGLKAQAKSAHRLAARLYKAGMPVYAAAREAVQRFKASPSGPEVA